jgi:hypothetical protein
MKLCALPILSLPILALLVTVSAVAQSSSAQSSAQVAELASAPLPAAPLPATPVAVHAGNAMTDADPAVVNTLREPRPAPERLHLIDWSMIGAGATLRALDYVTTQKGMEHPQYVHEGILPAALVHNKPAFAGFEAGTVVLNTGAYRLLVRHNMRSIARISQYLYVGVMTGQVAKNYQILGKIPAR